MKFDCNSTIGDILASEKGKAILEKYVPLARNYPNFDQYKGIALKNWAGHGLFGISRQEADTILEELNRPLFDVIPEAALRKSADEMDYISFQAGAAPMDGEPQWLVLHTGEAVHAKAPRELLLDGQWQLAEAGEEAARLTGEWTDAIPARVPGSIHTALVEAGRIPDPTIGVNQRVARQESYKTWWMKKNFDRPEGVQGTRLIFGGICNRCSIWLNGQLLGSHEGMFGGPEFDITPFLKESNTLIVKLEPIPFEPSDPAGTHPDIDNVSWKHTVVFNNNYGWHYSNLPSLGIWRPVKVCGMPEVALPDPFAAAKDAKKGQVEMSIKLQAKAAGWSGTLVCSILPENFSGAVYSFEQQVSCDKTETTLHLGFVLPEPHLWWPNDLGNPDLYRIRLSFKPDSGTGDCRELVFGLRTIEMAPLPCGARPDRFDWTFRINGEEHFVKGTGWCTMDPLMDFSYARYERFITLARQQHVQMLRGWGSGMPETDEFYDLCDRNGIMVLQEWPTAWNSHNDQPYDMLEETVRLNTLRLRNHPSLVMWGTNNESSHPFGPAIDMMGRLSVELDGTRPFHRGEPWGGSLHDYTCYWDRQHFDYNVNLKADFFGEFGLACMPVYESVVRYMPEEELNEWPPRPEGSFVYHTPVFGRLDDLSRLTQYARYFIPREHTMKEFITGSQLSQATGVRHTLERARTRWPDCSGALYYKMNDNFPAASWSCADWYGAPKIGHYIFQDAFAPLHVCVLFSTLNFANTPVELPVFLLDDAGTLRGAEWKVRVRAYNGSLKEIKCVEYSGTAPIETPVRVGSLSLSFEETDTYPLLVVAEVSKDGKLADRTFYWANFEAERGCLFKLPETQLSYRIEGASVTVINTGARPAVAVSIACPGHSDTFTVSDSYFWLNAGEEKTIEVNRSSPLEVSAWNAGIEGGKPAGR